jgi:hypothetical protein
MRFKGDEEVEREDVCGRGMFILFSALKLTTTFFFFSARLFLSANRS